MGCRQIKILNRNVGFGVSNSQEQKIQKLRGVLQKWPFDEKNFPEMWSKSIKNTFEGVLF